MKTLLLASALFLAFSVPAWSGFQEGDDAYGRGDYGAAWKEWKPLADQGDVKSQYGMGLLYVTGRGVQLDYAEGLSWFRKAAEQGNAKAQFMVGLMHARGRGVTPNLERAVEW